MSKKIKRAVSRVLAMALGWVLMVMAFLLNVADKGESSRYLWPAVIFATAFWVSSGITMLIIHWWNGGESE